VSSNTASQDRRSNFKVPADAKPGGQFTDEVVQRNDNGELISGFDVLVNVVAKELLAVQRWESWKRITDGGYRGRRD
jgi:hypothetical protein